MKDSLKIKRQLKVHDKTFNYFNLHDAAKSLGDISKLPFTLKILLENLLRFEDDKTVTMDDIKAIVHWQKDKRSSREIAFRPARVLMQDFTGVPAIVDLAAMRDAMSKLGSDPNKINPLVPVDLIIDHSVQVDHFASPDAYQENVAIEMDRNRERYEFLRWGQQAFQNFRVVPPGTGICHQVNLEYLATTVWHNEINGEFYAYPDTLVGTDSHTTMINGLGVLGWGVGGIEAEAALLGQPISMLIPEVVGFKLSGQLREGITATDLVLTVTQMLRKRGVVGKFVEFYGPGLEQLPLPDRATIANMAPEYGATCGFFPVDHETLAYLRLTGRSTQTIDLVEQYSKTQGLWHDVNSVEPEFTYNVELNLADVEPSLAGPKRPQDRVAMSNLKSVFDSTLKDAGKAEEKNISFKTTDGFSLHHGDVVIAAITSCTNTSNPSVLMAAGLLAKKAIEKGLTRKPWVKSSLAPGSKVVTEYLAKTGLQKYLDQLGFFLVGYGCTTCIGNSGPLDDAIAKTITENDLLVSAVLSGNRNFEGRVHPQVKANWLASPPLVVAYALAGTTSIDLDKEPIGEDFDGNPVHLKDIWPTSKEVAVAVAEVDGAMFRKEYADVFTGDEEWRTMSAGTGKTYQWNDESTYVKNPPYFTNLSTSKSASADDIHNLRILALFGDSVTTDHISPAGSIKTDSPAGKYLLENGIGTKDFNSYGSRRGNHEVMMRGTFANIRIKNEMVSGIEGGVTKYLPSDEVMPIYDAAMKYQETNTPLIIIAGKEYGTGSSRDWAAKGTLLLGVKAVVAESFERIHRSNLIGMGVLPLEFKENVNRHTLKLNGSEIINLIGLKNGMKPQMEITANIKYQDGKEENVVLNCRIDTQNELEYYLQGGILQYMLHQLM